jgi:hypothetical protein
LLIVISSQGAIPGNRVEAPFCLLQMPHDRRNRGDVA